MEMAIAVWCWPVARSELVTKARWISGLEPHLYFWHGGRKSELARSALRVESVTSLTFAPCNLKELDMVIMSK